MYTINSVNDLKKIAAQGAGEYDITYNLNGSTYNYKLVVGKNWNENAGVNLIGYGGGGASDNAFAEAFLKDNPTNSINIIPSDSNDFNSSVGANAAANLATNIKEAFGLDNYSYMPEGYSSTARNAIVSGIDYAKKNKDAKNFNILMVEPSDNVGEYVSQDSINLLNNRNATIIHVSGNPMCSDISTMSNDGLPIVDVKINYSVDGKKIDDWSEIHGATYRLLSTNGYMDISSGEFDFNNLPTKWEYNGKTYDLSYEFRKNDGKGNFTIISADDMNTITSFKGSTNFELSKIDLNSIPDTDKIASDNEYLAGELSKINYLLSNTKSVIQVSAESPSGGSTTNVPTAEPEIISNVIKTTEDLIEKMKIELKNIGQVGDTFETMNNFLADEAETLGLDVLNTETGSSNTTNTGTPGTTSTSSHGGSSYSNGGNSGNNQANSSPVQNNTQQNQPNPSPVQNNTQQNQPNPSPVQNNNEHISDIEDEIIDDEIVDDEIIDDEIIDDDIIEDDVIEDVVVPTVDTNGKKKGKNIFKALGTATALGAAAGGAVYAGKKMKEKHEENNEIDEDDSLDDGDEI